MKTVTMQGGLGNQMFCLAFAHSVRREGGGGAIDVSGFRGDRYGRRSELEPLANALGLTVVTAAASRVGRIVTRLACKLRLNGHLFEPPNPPASGEALRALIARGRNFHGYWQDEAYMLDPAGFQEPARAHLLALAPDAPRHGVVLHWRSYREEVRPDRRATPRADYYEQALRRLNDQGVPLDDVLVLSDDVEGARDLLGASGRDFAFSTLSQSEAMAIMIKAGHLVLSNSSFAWWGGALNVAGGCIAYPARYGTFHYPKPAARFGII